MAEQATKRERLRKTVQEFYALQSPKFRPDAESWMKHIHDIYGDDGHPGNDETSDIRPDTESWMKHIHAIYGDDEHPGNGKTGDILKRRAEKRRIVQSSDEELSIGKKSPLAQEGTDSSSDEDTRQNPKSKRLRLERGGGKGEHEERCQLSVAASLPCEESLTPFAAKTVGALQNHQFPSRKNGTVQHQDQDEGLIERAGIERVEGTNLEQDGGASGEEDDAIAADGLSNRAKCPSHTPVDDQSWSASSQDEESSEAEEEMSISDALGNTTSDGVSAYGSELDARSNDEESSGLKSPPSKAEAIEEDPTGACLSDFSQDEESSEAEEEMSISHARGIPMGSGASSSDNEPDASSNEEDSSGLKRPTSKACEKKPASASLSDSSQDEESSETEEEMSISHAQGITTDDGALSSGSEPEQDGGSSSGEDPYAVAADARSNRSKCPPHTPVDDQSASLSFSSQDEDRSEAKEEAIISDALGTTTGGGASPSDREPDARNNHEESSGLKTPPSEAEENEAEPAGMDCGSPEHRSTASEEASTQDECIDAAISLEIWDDGDQTFESSQEAITEIDKISRSKLQMTLQGLKAKRLKSAATNTHDGHLRRKTSPNGISAATDPESVTYKGKTFYRGRCYRYREISIRTSSTMIDAIVGVLRLFRDGHAECVL
jgi:hypothetical protein